MTDFRALCEELNGLLEYISDISPHLCEDEINNLTNSARAALAEQPVGPTDEELKAAYWEAFKNSAACGAEESWLAGLRAVARWGQPAATPIPVAERLPGPEDLNGILEECWWYDHACWYLDTYQANYTHWLPVNALPLPAND
jgi:hypothetical protein